MDIYLFDVEQSLAPIGSNMNSEFQNFFIEWMKQKNSILVPSSERTNDKHFGKVVLGYINQMVKHNIVVMYVDIQIKLAA